MESGWLMNYIYSEEAACPNCRSTIDKLALVADSIYKCQRCSCEFEWYSEDSSFVRKSGYDHEIINPPHIINYGGDNYGWLIVAGLIGVLSFVFGCVFTVGWIR